MPVRMKLRIYHIPGCIAVYYHHIAIAIIVTPNSNQNEEKPVLTFPSSLELSQLPIQTPGPPPDLHQSLGFREASDTPCLRQQKAARSPRWGLSPP